jgi:predicted small metal-binding protein
MAEKIKKFKQLSCRYVGGNCHFVAQAETEEKVIELTFDHGCTTHNICEVSPETERNMRSLIMDVWA